MIPMQPINEVPPVDAVPQCGPILNISAYKFVYLDHVSELREKLLRVCNELKLRGTILLSSEGINLVLAGIPASVSEFLSYLKSDPAFSDLTTKESYSATQPFHRMLVRLKKEIIAFGVEGVAPEKKTSPKISPRQLQEWLDEGRSVRLLDTRNIYEYELGTFNGAEQLHINHFREFPQAIARLSEEAKKQPLVMFCTGGIRCEKAGPMMEQAGFEQVYQLDGGILKYFEHCGGKHYHGSCFVFDGRVALDPELKPTGNLLCFACQEVLSPEEVASKKYVLGQSCPRCYGEFSERLREQLEERQAAIRALAVTQPGCSPYTQIRKIFVPRRFAVFSLVDFLDAWHPPTSRQQWKAWIDAGQIHSRGTSVSFDRIVKEGESFEQQIPGMIEPLINPDILLIHEDDWIVVVNKPAPLPVHPSGRYNRNTLSSLMGQFYPKQKLRIAHRLDSETSGVVVLCRSYQAARLVQPQFGDGTISKTYLARVHGHPTWDKMLCEATISSKPEFRGTRGVNVPEGLEARTEFRVLRRASDGTTIVEATPLTGRTHQIRLHLHHLGHAIVGDRLYGPSRCVARTFGEEEIGDADECDEEPALSSSAEHPATAAMCLQAAKISLVHPASGQRQTFEAPTPVWFCC